MDPDWQPELGSAPYYSIRFSPEQHRHNLQLIFTWQQLLRTMLAEATDPGVSRLKLDWWQQELLRAEQNQARHPLAIQLQPVLAIPGVSHLFKKILMATDKDLQQQSIPTTQTWYEHCDQCGENLVQLLVLASQGSKDDYDKLVGLGRYIEVIDRISILSRIKAEFHFPLPKESLLELAKQTRTRAVDVLKNTQATSAMTSALCLGAQTRALDKKLLQHNYDVRENAIEILPITRFWHAWKMRP